MQKLNSVEYNDLIRDGQVLISDASGNIMVFLTSFGDIVKKLLYKEKYLLKNFSARDSVSEKLQTPD